MTKTEANALIANIAVWKGPGLCFGTAEERRGYECGCNAIREEVIDMIRRAADNVPDNAQSLLAALCSVITSAVKQPTQEINACEESCCENAPNAVGLSLSPPWIIYAAEVKKLFELDEAVSVGGVVDGDDGKTVHIRTADHRKADALYVLLKSPVRFGNVELRLAVHDDSDDDSPALFVSEEDKVNAAFKGNRLFRGVRTKETSDGFNRSYLVMDSTPVQFWGDNLASYRGLITMLPEQIAADVLEIPGMGICTADLRENERRCNDGEGRLSENGGK